MVGWITVLMQITKLNSS